MMSHGMKEEEIEALGKHIQEAWLLDNKHNSRSVTCGCSVVMVAVTVE
jgi:hypothetical protein